MTGGGSGNEHDHSYRNGQTAVTFGEVTAAISNVAGDMIAIDVIRAGRHIPCAMLFKQFAGVDAFPQIIGTAVEYCPPRT